MFCGEGVTAGDIVKLCLKDDTGVDYAVPQPWLDEVTKLGIKTKFVWSYRRKDGITTYGHPVALGDMVLDGIADGKLVLMTTEEYTKLAGV